MKYYVLILLLFSACFSLIGCTNVNGTVRSNQIDFSLTRDEKTAALGEKTNVFKMSDDTFYYSTPLSGNTAKYEIILEKDGSVFTDDKDTINVSPDWTGMTSSYTTPYQEGKYTMKVFSIKDERLVGIGDFEVVK